MIESSQNEADPAGGPGTALAEPEILLGSGQRAPRRARGQLRVEALLASAAEVFARKGFDAATMTEIAAQADSSIGSLYQFFRTKEAVAEALLQLQIAGLWERFDALGERAAALPTTRLGAELARLLVDFRAAHPSFATLVEMPGPPLKAVTGVRRRVRERVAEVLARRAPGAAPALLATMAPVVQHTMKAAIQLRGDLPEDAEHEAAMAELETMLGGYLVERLGA